MIITDKAQIKVASLKESDKLHLTTSDELECYELIESDLKLPADATFTRSSVAYLSDGTQVPANTPRFEPGKFGKAWFGEEGTTNLLSNPSFESDSNGDGLADSWSVHNNTGATCSYQRVIGKCGSYAQRMTKTDWITQTEDKYSAFIQIVTGLTAGTTYVLSVDYKLTMTSSSVDAPRSVGVVIYHKDSSNSVKNTTISWGWAPTAEWIRKTVTFTLATGADRIEIHLRMSCNGTVDWDGVQLEAKPYATSFIDDTRADEALTIPGSVLNPQEGTIEFWWNPLAKTPGTNPSLISTGKWTSDRSQDWLAIYWGSEWNNANEVRFGLVNGTTKQGYIDQAITLNPSPFTWYFIAFKWDFANTQTAKLLIYKPDGSLLTKQVSLAGIPAPSFAGWDKFYVLQRWDNGPDRANSLIDDLRISSIARSDEEILAAYQSGQPLPVDEWTTYKLDFDDKVRITTQGQIICNELIEI